MACMLVGAGPIAHHGRRTRGGTRATRASMHCSNKCRNVEAQQVHLELCLRAGFNSSVQVDHKTQNNPNSSAAVRAPSKVRKVI